jgi:hypothetical protein
MSNPSGKRRTTSILFTIAVALGIVIASGVAPAQAGPPPLNVQVDENLYGYEISAGAALFGQNGFVADRAAEIAQSLATCPACTPNPSTPMPAGYSSLKMVSASVNNPTDLVTAMGAALYAAGATVVDGTDADSIGNVGLYTVGTTTYGVFILAEYAVPPLDELLPFNVTISGPLRLGAQLTANVDEEEFSATETYQWYENNSPLGAVSNSPTLSLQAAQLHQHISVKVTESRSGFVNRSETSAQVGPIGPAFIVGPRVLPLGGTSYIGTQLDVSTDSLAPFLRVPGVHLRYIWTRNRVPIIGAPDAPTYTVARRDDGKYINVIVIVTAPGYVPAIAQTHNTVVTSVNPTGGNPTGVDATTR